ncbi:MAG: hypothetical protein WCQ67_01590 [Treponema sp.]
MANSKKSLGLVFVQIALAVYFIVTGLCMLGVGGSIKSFQITGAVYSIFSGSLANIVNIILGILILACGVVLVIKFFWNPGKIDNTLMLITLIVWIVVAVIVDLFSHEMGIFSGDVAFLTWLLDVAKNLLIIGGLMTVHN